MSDAKDKFSKAIAYEEWEKDPIWQRFLDCQEEWQRPNTQIVNDLMSVVTDGTRKEFLQRLKHANDAEYAVDFERHALGVAFAMQRVIKMFEDGENNFISLSSERLRIAPENVYFTTYGDDNITPTQRPLKITDNFTLERNGGPFIYKAKYTPVRQFGAVEDDEREPHYDYNQMLKYNEAIEQGLISGAAIEIRGLIDPDFLNWALGASVIERSDVPHVQLIYNMPLPSGAEYRFTLKKAQSYSAELDVTNDTSGYTKADKAVVQGIENALRSQDQVQLIEILSGQSVFAHKGDLKAEFKQFSCPIHEAELKDPAFYDNYLQTMRMGIWKRALRIKPETYNHDKDTVFSPENIGIEDEKDALKARIEAYQADLRRTQGHLIVNSNSLGDDPESPEYQALLNEVTEEFAKNIALIRSRDNKRRAEEAKNPNIVGNRLQQGYSGLENGFALELYVIMVDSIAIVKSRKNDKVQERSFEHADGHFMDIDGVLGMLDERADSRYQVVSIYDPLAKDGKRRQVTENISDDALIGKQITVTRENNKRVQKYLQDADEGKVKLSSNEKTRLRQMKKEILSVQAEIADLNQRRAMQSQLISAEKKAGHKIKADHPLQQKMDELMLEGHALQAKLWDRLHGVLDPHNENKLTQKAFTQEKNIIKIIYTIDHKGRITFEEEKPSERGRASRATHSELSGGENIFGAGEIIFSKPAGLKNWEILEINNGSGHYRPPPQTLRYTANCLMKELHGAFHRRGLKGQEAKNAVYNMLNKARLTDALARGITLKNEEQDLRNELTASAQLMAAQHSQEPSLISPKQKAM